MTKLRITKYNPQYRNDNGSYIKGEWTDISDIGKTFGDDIFTIEKYINTENKYIKAAEILADIFNLSKFYTIGLEGKSERIRHSNSYPHLYDRDILLVLKNIRDGGGLDIANLGQVCRLVLRNELWCQIVVVSPSIRITFGHDYYMYFELEYSDVSFVKRLQKTGLYVEEII